MKTKSIACFTLLTLLSLCFISTKAEARNHFSFNIGGLFGLAPQPVVYERYVYPAGPVYVEPGYGPVYVTPAPVVVASPRYYIAPRPCYREVYVQPQQRVSTGISFSFFN